MQSRPSLPLRIAQFPLTRLLVLGPLFVLAIAVSNGLREQSACASWLALAMRRGHLRPGFWARGAAHAPAG